METKDIGRLFIICSPLRDAKEQALVFREEAWELDPPYRYSNSFVLRLPRQYGIMVGWWKKSPATSLQDHFQRALTTKIKGIIIPVADSHEIGGGAVQRVTRDAEYWDNLTEEEILGYLAEIPKLDASQHQSIFAVTDHDPF